MTAPLRREDHREAYDLGARAMAAHLLEGAARPRSPWCSVARRTHYWQRGAKAMAQAIRQVRDAAP